MNCRKTKKLLTRYSGNLRNGLKEGEKLTELKEHLSVCPECRRKLVSLECAERLLFAIPLREPPAGLWDGLRARIVAGAALSEGGNQKSKFVSRQKSLGYENGISVLIPYSGSLLSKLLNLRRIFSTPHSFVALVASVIVVIFVGFFFLRPFFNSQESISPDGLASIYVEQHALRAWRDPLADRAWLGWSAQFTTEDPLRRGLPQEMKLKNQ